MKIKQKYNFADYCWMFGFWWLVVGMPTLILVTMILNNLKLI